MKKILLSMFAACAVFGASAAATDLKPVWNKSVDNAFGSDRVWNACVDVDAQGNVIAAGAFAADITIGSATLAPVGTSAYIAKYDVAGNVLWAVGITGAASVVAIDTDEAGNVYLAGTYADEITFGTTAGDEIVKPGQIFDGAPTSKLNSSFIAKYDANGAVEAVQTFVPQYIPGLMETGSYWPADGDCYFRINHLQVTAGNVYASAVYTGATSVLDKSFTSFYNLVFGFMPLDLKSTAIFSLDENLTKLDHVATYSPGENEMTDDAQFDASAVTFTVDDDGVVYGVFAGNGPLTIEATGEKKAIDAQASEYNYLFAKIYDGKLQKLTTEKCPDAGMETLFVPYAVFVKNNQLTVVGYEAFAENYNTADERIGHEVFTFTGGSGLSGINKSVCEIVEGNVALYDICGAAMTEDGAVLVSVLGYYTDKVEGDGGHSKGDFANTSKAFMLAGSQPFAVPGSDNCYGIDANGAYAVMSQITDNGQAYTLFNDPAGVSDIVLDSADTPVEYYNLQGIRVDNPANGVFIRRHAGKTVKVLVK